VCNQAEQHARLVDWSTPTSFLSYITKTLTPSSQKENRHFLIFQLNMGRAKRVARVKIEGCQWRGFYAHCGHREQTRVLKRRVVFDVQKVVKHDMYFVSMLSTL